VQGGVPRGVGSVSGSEKKKSLPLLQFWKKVSKVAKKRAFVLLIRLGHAACPQGFLSAAAEEQWIEWARAGLACTRTRSPIACLRFPATHRPRASGWLVYGLDEHARPYNQ
jgi:hypothetical protein